MREGSACVCLCGGAGRGDSEQPGTFSLLDAKTATSFGVVSPLSLSFLICRAGCSHSLRPIVSSAPALVRGLGSRDRGGRWTSENSAPCGSIFHLSSDLEGPGPHLRAQSQSLPGEVLAQTQEVGEKLGLCLF